MPEDTVSKDVKVAVADASEVAAHVKTEIEKLGDEAKKIEVTILSQPQHMIWLVASIALVIGIFAGHFIK